MRRREFIALLAAAAAWPQAARAQQGSNLPLLGVLSPISVAAAARNIAALRAGLRDLGYVEGHNVAIALRFADGVIERMPALAAELVALKPAVIVAGSPPAALAAHELTRTIPIVMNSAPDPVALGLAASLARPGGNVTGFWWGDEGLVGKQLQLLKEVVPGLSRVGIAVHPGYATSPTTDMLGVAGTLGLAARLIEVKAATDFETVFATAAQEQLQGLHFSTSPLFTGNRATLAALAARAQLPVVYGIREFVTAGGLMSYGTDLPDLYRRKALLVDKILKGAKPADLPIERPTKFELAINVKAAKDLGLTLSESLLLRADEVIE